MRRPSCSARERIVFSRQFSQMPCTTTPLRLSSRLQVNGIPSHAHPSTFFSTFLFPISFSPNFCLAADHCRLLSFALTEILRENSQGPLLIFLLVAYPPVVPPYPPKLNNAYIPQAICQAVCDFWHPCGNRNWIVWKSMTLCCSR